MTSDMEVDAMDWLGWGVFGLIATATLTAVLIGVSSRDSLGLTCH
jgi:hypothetical protein